MGLQWAELFLETTVMAKSMGPLGFPGLVSSAQTYGKGTEMESALFKSMDWISLKRYGFLMRERVVKSDNYQQTFKKLLT